MLLLSWKLYSVLEEVCILRYLHNNITMLIPKFRNEGCPKIILAKSRSCRPEVFCKKGVLENFTKLTGKHQYQSLFCKIRRCFPVNFVNFLRTPFLYNTSGGCFSKVITVPHFVTAHNFLYQWNILRIHGRFLRIIKKAKKRMK